VERGEIYDFIRAEKITGFAAVSGDRHSFWAGARPSAAAGVRAGRRGLRHRLDLGAGHGGVASASFPKDHPLRPLFLADRPRETRAAVNMLMRHGVRSCLDTLPAATCRRPAPSPTRTTPRTSTSSTWAATATRW
jgi:alkaline phosphatase D